MGASFLACLFACISTTYGFSSMPEAVPFRVVYADDTYSIIGTAPAMDSAMGGVPVIIISPPTCLAIDSPILQIFLQSTVDYIVSKGFAAAIVELPESSELPGEPIPGEFCATTGEYDASKIDADLACVIVQDKADRMWSGNDSAIASLCASGLIDCDKGIGILGISQGAFVAALAEDSRIQALVMIASWVNNCPGHVHPKNTVRHIKTVASNQDEYIFQGGAGCSSACMVAQMQQMAGLNVEECGVSTECSSANGTGYSLISGLERIPSFSWHSSFTQQVLSEGSESWKFQQLVDKMIQNIKY